MVFSILWFASWGRIWNHTSRSNDFKAYQGTPQKYTMVVDGLYTLY
jgi:hypothetical protein